ncbi:uncharacterized protein LOC127837119 [Dreissena polymorpha]|uniref:Protein kinase domain-containing protein n=1 Tax=Dreissena polymorpha TaxID=45954 RepID=A0A9D4J511_DREPO|nr:uncharacterized protein LOC127837119 [Dreissena polymorpha]KAH3795577.1 hypothetical protein DPMN_149131 [Dreissena polymorpha]
MANLDEDTEVKSLKTKVMAPVSEMDPFVNINGAKENEPLAEGLLPDLSCCEKNKQSICSPKTSVSMMNPRLLVQCDSYLPAVSPLSDLRPVKQANRVLSFEKGFYHDDLFLPGGNIRPKHLYGENVKQSQFASYGENLVLLNHSIVYGTKKMCADFAAQLHASPPPLSKTTGVITNHDVYKNIQEICGVAEQNNHPFTNGGFGTVSSITLCNGLCILRKRIKRCNFLNNEVTIPCYIRHPNIMDIYGVLATFTHVDLLMENAGVSLIDFMKGNRLDDCMIVRFSWQLISGVKELGRYGFRHLDLKPNNVCIYQDKDGSLNLKIIDFGSAKLASERNDFKGLTPEYMAPELCVEKLAKYMAPELLWEKLCIMNKSEKITSEKVDLYSAGLTILYMLTGKHVFRRVGKDISIYKSIFDQICLIDFSKHIPEHCPKVIKDPLENLLKKDPKERWTTEQFLEALQSNGNCPELQVNIQKVPCKRKAEKQTLRNDMTDGSVSMDTLENETMGVSCPRESMPAPLVDLHEGTVQNLPATNFEVYGMVNTVSKGRKPVARFKKPRLDPQDGTERSICKAPYTEGWKPTDLVVTFSQSAKVMDDKPTVVDQAGDQHAGQEADESGMSTGGVTDEGEVHQPTTDDAVADDVARNGSMRDPPDDQQNNRLPCFEELLSDMDSSSSIKSRGSASHPKTWA